MVEAMKNQASRDMELTVFSSSRVRFWYWYFPFSRNGGGNEERGQPGHGVYCVHFLLAVDLGTNIFRFLEMVEAMKNVASLDIELTVFNSSLR